MDLKNKRVLVTGAGGFIGSHLVEKLVECGAQVRAFVRYNSKNLWGWLETSPVCQEIQIFTGDLRDFDSVKKAVQGTDVVFHLGALIGIPYSYTSPLAYLKTNVEGTYNILQAAREAGTQRVVLTSTSEVYGTAQYVPIDESHPMQPQSPYSASKISADMLGLSYYLSFRLPVVIARPFNTYGPRQSARAIIPTIITQILSGRRELSLGNTSPTRDLNYVLDTVNGFIQLAQAEQALGQVVNIGSGREIAIGELVNLIASLMQTEVVVVQDSQRVRPEKSEVERLLCNAAKIRSLTSWQPEYTLEQGLAKTIEWFEKNMAYYKPEVYNV